MVLINTAYRDAPEKWSSTLFSMAGVLLVGHTAIGGVRLITDLSPPTGIFAAPGHLIAVVGLLLLSPMLADRTPSLAQAAAIMAILPTAGWFVITAEQLVEAAGIVPSSVTLPPVFYLVVLVSTIITYTLVTIACHRTDVAPRTLAPLLFAPAIIIAMGFTVRVLIEEPALVGFVTGSGLALAMLAIGYTLRSASKTDRKTLTGGVPTG